MIHLNHHPAIAPRRSRPAAAVRPRPRVGHGFSLIEMLVVLSLISLVAVISFPFLKTTLQSTAVNASAGQVSNSLSAARVFATRTKNFVAARRVGNTLRSASGNGDGYSGTIVLFAPDNSLRVMENDQNAFDPTNLPFSAGWLELQVPPLNGYTPVPDLEDIRYPGRVQMLGIVRTGNGAYDVRLVPPPFAIRVNADGAIGQGADDGTADGVPWDRVVYVSASGVIDEIGGDGDPGTEDSGVVITEYDVTSQRTNFGSSTIEFSDFGRQGERLMDDGRLQLPFDSIETVSGVVVLEPERVPVQFAHPDGSAPADINYRRDNLDVYSEDASARILHWASENATYARILLFNRYTGQDLTR